MGMLENRLVMYRHRWIPETAAVSTHHRCRVLVGLWEGMDELQDRWFATSLLEPTARSQVELDNPASGSFMHLYSGPGASLLVNVLL